MRCNAFLVVLLLFPAAAQSSWARSFEYAVQHQHTFKDCKGTLKISEAGVEYQASQPKDSRKWQFDEIQVLKINSPGRISFVSYEDQRRYLGKDRTFVFRLLDKKVTAELSSFLLSRVRKPMVVAVLPEDGKPVFEIPVKHLHTIAGIAGVLQIYPDRVAFRSAKTAESRFWRLADIERFSQPDRFRFQIVSYIPKAGGPTEVYNFQLLQDLPEGVYDYFWVRLHPSSYYPEVKP